MNTPASKQKDRRERVLGDEISKAMHNEPNSDRQRLASIEQRAMLYTAAYLNAKQPELAALPHQPNAADQITQRLQELRNQTVDPIAPETAARWAMVDARDFQKLPADRQAEAAGDMADNLRGSASYRTRMLQEAPQLAARVLALDAQNPAKEAAKEDRKGVAAPGALGARPEHFRGGENVETEHQRMAQAFAKEPVEAAKQHSVLAGAAAAVAALDRKAQADGLTSEQRSVVAARVRSNVVNSIEQGEIPNVQLREVQIAQHRQELTR